MTVQFVTVARVDEIRPGRALQVFIDDEPIAICNVGGEFYAICDICTHDNYYLSYGRIDGDEIECPGHAAVFNIRTGEVEVPPAEKPVKTYPCQVVNGEVQVGVDW
ncbi:MAG: biphenyl 2,3-dioxygenase [Chloroflexi bacterium]|nr:MAG: biphenyl 2,3-dioxygenase [Chloroflexota bacterium]